MIMHLQILQAVFLAWIISTIALLNTIALSIKLASIGNENSQNTTDIAIISSVQEKRELEERQHPPPNPDFVWLAVEATALFPAPEFVGVARLVV